MAISSIHGSLELFRWMIAHGMPRVGSIAPPRVAELGNQRLFDNIRTTGKIICECLGFEHVSFDSNGKDGAVPHDLCTPIPDIYRGFDYVTNFGTSEHCQPSQSHVFANMHNLCSVGGTMFHNVPGADTCKGHGFYKYSVGWFCNLAKMNGYHPERVFEVPLGAGHRGPAGDYYVSAVLRRTSLSAFNLLAWAEPQKG